MTSYSLLWSNERPGPLVRGMGSLCGLQKPTVVDVVLPKNTRPKSLQRSKRGPKAVFAFILLFSLLSHLNRSIMSALTFESLNPPLSAGTFEVVRSWGFKQMTPVQAATIPLFMSNKDVCVEATTGSGKTLAFGIPMVEILMRTAILATPSDDDESRDTSESNRRIGALVLAPTRELATQIHNVLTSLCNAQKPPLRAVLFTGGNSTVNDNIGTFLNDGANVVVGTPGRIADLHARCEAFRLNKVEVLILDEADTLLDMGFRDIVLKILSLLPKQRRTGLFSATQTKEVKDLARAGLRNPVTVSVKVNKDAKANHTLLAGAQAAAAAAKLQHISMHDIADNSRKSSIGNDSSSTDSSSSGDEDEQSVVSSGQGGSGQDHSFESSADENANTSSSDEDVSDLDDTDPLDAIAETANMSRKAPTTKSAPVSVENAVSLDVERNALLTTIATPTTLSNFYAICPYDRRPDELVSFLRAHTTDKVIVFCATCACVEYYSYVFRALTRPLPDQAGPAILPANFQVFGMHGKQVPKRRTAVYESFVALNGCDGSTGSALSTTSSNAKEHKKVALNKLSGGGVLFCTDVAARGIDIPDVNWIVQLAAPKDPAFFVHRVGRTARAGRSGGALLFVTEEESAYIELLRGRGVPLVARPLTANVANTEDANTLPTLSQMKYLATIDRTALESGSTAFMAFLRSYKEHLCSFIFKLDKLDIGSVARSYALVKLPKIPETRGKLGASIRFETTYMDTSTVPYKHVQKEKARQQRLKAVKEEQARIEAQIAAEEAAELQELEHSDSDANSDAAVNSGDDKTAKSLRSLKSLRSVRTARTNITTGTKQSERMKVQWVPAEQYEQEGLADERAKRARAKKLSIGKKIRTEFEELQAEEAAYKKFKRGKITKEQYDNICLLAEVAPDKESIEKLHVKGNEQDSDGFSDSDDDSDKDSKTNVGNTKKRKLSSDSDKEEEEEVNSRTNQNSSLKAKKHSNNQSKNVSFFQFPDGPRSGSAGDAASVKSFRSMGGSYKSTGSVRSMSSKRSQIVRKPMHDVEFQKKTQKVSKVGAKPDYRKGKLRR